MRRRSSMPAIWPGMLLAMLLGGAIVGTQYSSQLAALVNLGNTQRTSGTSYELSTVKMDDGQQLITRWNPCQKDITWTANLDNIPASDRADTLAEVKEGFQKLHQATGMTYKYKGTTDFIPTNENLQDQPAEITVTAAEPTDTDMKFDGALGFGGKVWATWTKDGQDGAAIVRGYVVLSPSGLASLKPGYESGMSQGNLILHELGHASGLEHAGSSNEIMYPDLSKSSRDGYGKGDLDGLAAVGKDAGCIAIPSSVGVKDLS